MGLARISLSYKIEGIGDKAKSDVVQSVSGLTRRTDGFAMVSTTSMALSRQTMTSCLGIYIQVISTTSTNPLYVYMSGLLYSQGIILQNGQGCYFQPANRLKAPHFYSDAAAYFEFCMFGK